VRWKGGNRWGWGAKGSRGGGGFVVVDGGGGMGGRMGWDAVVVWRGALAWGVGGGVWGGGGGGWGGKLMRG